MLREFRKKYIEKKDNKSMDTLNNIYNSLLAKEEIF